MDRFVSLEEVEREGVEELLRLAARLERGPDPEALRGRLLALVFLDSSIGMRISLQVAMARLGGSCVVVGGDRGAWPLEVREGVVMDGESAEHVREAIPILSSCCDAVAVRVDGGRADLESDLRDSFLQDLCDVCPGPVLNMGSAVNHPFEALAGWKTLEDIGVPSGGGKLVLAWTHHTEALALAVPATVIHMAAMRGMEVTVLRPEGYGLPEPVMERATRAAASRGGAVFETNDRREAMEGAHVLFASSWVSPENYGSPATELRLRKGLEYWCVDESWFERARPEARFMHALPVRRGVEVKDEVLDGKRSVLVRQAHNRVLVEMAVLHAMLYGETR